MSISFHINPNSEKERGVISFTYLFPRGYKRESKHTSLPARSEYEFRDNQQKLSVDIVQIKEVINLSL